MIVGYSSLGELARFYSRAMEIDENSPGFVMLSLIVWQEYPEFRELSDVDKR